MKILFTLPVIFLIATIVIAIHQFVFYGVFFEMENLHHETWMIMFVFAGFILVVSRKR